jgi:hypothetical protein
MIKTSNKFTNILKETLVILSAIGVLVVFAYSIDYRPLDRINHVSIFSKLVLVSISQVSVFYIILKSRFFNRLQNFDLFLAFLYGSLMGILFVGYLLALRGTKYSFGPTGSDIWNLQVMAQSYLDFGSVEHGYPPGYPLSLGLLSRLSETTPELSMKLLNYAFALINIVIGWILLRIVYESYLVLTLASTLNIINLLGHDKPYFLLAIYLFYPPIIYFTRQIINDRQNFSFISSIYVGLSTGLSVYFYSAWAYWFLLGTPLLFYILWKKSTDKGYFIKNILIVIFCFLVASNKYGWNTIIGKVIQHKDKVISGRQLPQETWGLNQSIHYLGENFLNLQFFDWIFIDRALIFVLVLSSIFAFIQNKSDNLELYFIFLVFLSSFIFGIYLASRMYDLQAINLWPRSESAMVISILFLIPSSMKFFRTIFFKYLDLVQGNYSRVKIIGTFSLIFVFCIYSPLVNSFVKLMPSPGNTSYESHIHNGNNESTTIKGKSIARRIIDIAK